MKYRFERIVADDDGVFDIPDGAINIEPRYTDSVITCLVPVLPPVIVTPCPRCGEVIPGRHWRLHTDEGWIHRFCATDAEFDEAMRARLG